MKSTKFDDGAMKLLRQMKADGGYRTYSDLIRALAGKPSPAPKAVKVDDPIEKPIQPDPVKLAKAREALATKEVKMEMDKPKFIPINERPYAGPIAKGQKTEGMNTKF